MYVVLMKSDAESEHPVWIEVGRAEGADGTAAIKQIAEAGFEGQPLSGVFVAVPARSFSPAALRFENVQKAVWDQVEDSAPEPTEAPAEPEGESESFPVSDPTA